MRRRRMMRDLHTVYIADKVGVIWQVVANLDDLRRFALVLGLQLIKFGAQHLLIIAGRCAVFNHIVEHLLLLAGQDLEPVSNRLRLVVAAVGFFRHSDIFSGFLED